MNTRSAFLPAALRCDLDPQLVMPLGFRAAAGVRTATITSMHQDAEPRGPIDAIRTPLTGVGRYLRIASE